MPIGIINVVSCKGHKKASIKGFICKINVMEKMNDKMSKNEDYKDKIMKKCLLNFLSIVFYSVICFDLEFYITIF